MPIGCQRKRAIWFSEVFDLKPQEQFGGLLRPGTKRKGGGDQVRPGTDSLGEEKRSRNHPPTQIDFQRLALPKMADLRFSLSYSTCRVP